MSGEPRWPQGYLSLVLHAHLPFVRHPEHEKFLEENWLFEAITETYVPLLQILEWLAAGWHGHASHTYALADALRDAARPAAARTLRTAPEQPH